MFNLFESVMFKKNSPYLSYPENIPRHKVELVPVKSSPEHVILLDTDVTDWSNWTRNTGKYEGWRQQTHPILQRKIYGVCQIAQEYNDNWLYSPPVYVNEAKSITIEITFTIRECSEHPNSEVLQHCQEVLELLLKQVDVTTSDEKNLNQTQNSFIKLATLSTTSQKSKHDSSTEGFLIGWNVSNQNKNNLPDSSSEQVTAHISRFNVQNENIQIAIRDRGSCSTIRRVRLGYTVCPFLRNNFIEYPRTITGKIMEGLTVDGRCISGAALINHKEIPKLICQNDGVWYYEAIKSYRSGEDKHFNIFSKNNPLNHLNKPCECMPGFGVLNEDNIMDQLCEPCGLHYFKPTFGPFTCQRCPLNSHNPFHALTSRSVQRFNLLNYRPKTSNYNESNLNEIDSCVCDAGYYRHPILDKSDSSCTKVPSAPRNVTVNLSDPARVQLSWNEPLDTGGRSHIWYIINCLEIPNQSCSPHLTIIPTVPTLMTSIVLIGLNLGKSIILSVIATNELSEHLPQLELIQSTASITIQLPNPINISVGSVHFNEVRHWQANKSTTHQLTIDPNLYDKTRKNSVDKVYEFSWEPPQFVTSKSFIQISQSDYKSQTADLQTNSLNADFSVIEYQVYVWINSSAMEFEDTYWQSKPALTHFLSETSVFLTDLPQPGILGIWVRPHLSAGWGIFKKSVYRYSNTDESYPNEEESVTYDSLLMDSNSKDSISSNVSEIIKPAQTSKRFRILMGILGLGVILLCSLLVILIFLRFCAKRSRSTEENTQMETVLVPNSMNGMTEKHTPCDLQLEDQDSPVASEHSTPLKSTMCDPSQPAITIPETSKEIDPRRIMIRSTIGEGEFGKVCAGDFITTGENKIQLVAIKMLHPDVSEKTRQDFLTEANTLSQLDHPNIVQLIGLVTKSEPKMIVIEFMENGSMDNYLRRNGNTLSMEQLLYMLRDVACGMNYLSRLNFVHRDLAARNILVDKFNVCKVSDFGLTRKCDSDSDEDAYTFTGGKVPIRWMAPEAIMYRKITFASDVWSFGIVTWELFSLGERPYWNWTNQAVIAMLEKGYRLPSPNICPADIYKIVTSCWNSNPDQRPDFSSICVEINRFIESYLQTNKQIEQLSTNHLKNDNTSLTPSLNDDLTYFILPKPYDSSLNTKINNNTSGNNNTSQISRTSSYKMYTSSSSSNTYFNINAVNMRGDGSLPNSTTECENELLLNDFKDTVQHNLTATHDTGKRENSSCSQTKSLQYPNSMNRNECHSDLINGAFTLSSKLKCNGYA
ncbi:unnamed protein product [Schistosoma turkestanicum]|nr:unnamed protein product [Schistosoma turkestanicum]